MPVASNIFVFQKLRLKLIAYVGIILVGGFLATNFLSYQISKNTIRATVLENELPLSSNNIYSEIQTDLLRPVFISSLMANDTFLIDWITAGEKDPDRIIRYLKNIRDKYDAFTSYFISAETLNYYHFSGLSRALSSTDPDDQWFFRVSKAHEDYEINIDINKEQGGAITIFINYRVLDDNGRFIGVAGVGLGLDSVSDMIKRYQDNFRRSIYFVNPSGDIELQSERFSANETNIHQIPGLGAIAGEIFAKNIGAFIYKRDGETYLLTTRYLPELKWYLLIELSESQATKGLWRSFLVNLGIGSGVIILTIFLIAYTVNTFQSRLEEMASTDKLTGLGNRQTFEIVLKQANAQFDRSKSPYALILFDIDHFKIINDTYGHLNGDAVLKKLAVHLRGLTRKSDILCRWGGEEFIILAPDCGLSDARRLAENIRTSIMEGRFVDKNPDLQLTLSAGIAEAREAESGEQIVARADKALYAAKDKGRNRVEAG
jgi:diguanylate cyclase (GGDEF)-like protein